MKNKLGVSLAELLAVVVIMGIIAAIAVPLVGRLIEDTKKDEILGDAISIVKSAELYCMTNESASLCKALSVDTSFDNIVYLTTESVSTSTYDRAPGFEKYISQDFIYTQSDASNPLGGFSSSSAQYIVARLSREADGTFVVVLQTEDYVFGDAVHPTWDAKLVRGGMKNPLTYTSVVECKDDLCMKVN